MRWKPPLEILQDAVAAGVDVKEATFIAHRQSLLEVQARREYLAGGPLPGPEERDSRG